ncbi:MAG: dTDP-4-dehydrorhamnose 3,5-epimerase family protein [Spirochaetes bacterium]|nr:dTDP-4-dehydrorhamnose 3,5-epimerase family protein [Spirochaetota bacterium]
MEFKKGKIKGVKINKLQKYNDARGFLIENFRIDELPDKIKPEMSYISFTNPGISRGPHEHEHQTDVFSFVGPGDFSLKLWDNRKNSDTYNYHMEIIAGESNPVTVVIPPGVIHGYKNTSKEKMGMVLNFPDKLYKGWGKKEEVDEVRHEEDADSKFHL